MNTRLHALVIALVLLGPAGAALAAGPTPLIPDTPPAGVVSDTEFIRRASEASSAESEMSQLAVNLSIDAEVRGQAGSLVQDHLRNRDQLQALARSKDVDLSAVHEATYQAAIDDLRNLSGRDFDLAYLRTVRTDHEMLVGLFQGAAAHATDADVRKYASDMLPVLQAHLAQAQQLEIKRR